MQSRVAVFASWICLSLLFPNFAYSSRYINRNVRPVIQTESQILIGYLDSRESSLDKIKASQKLLDTHLDKKSAPAPNPKKIDADSLLDVGIAYCNRIIGCNNTKILDAEEKIISLLSDGDNRSGLDENIPSDSKKLSFNPGSLNEDVTNCMLNGDAIVLVSNYRREIKNNFNQSRLENGITFFEFGLLNNCKYVILNALLILNAVPSKLSDGRSTVSVVAQSQNAPLFKKLIKTPGFFNEFQRELEEEGSLLENVTNPEITETITIYKEMIKHI